MEYHMLYVKSRKNFEMRREKRFITLLCEKHTANLLLCRVKNTWQIYYFTVCQKKHTAKHGRVCT